MTSLIDTIINLPLPVLNHWGYWIILLAAILEASPIFGLFIPGQMIVILGGFFVKLNILDIGDTIFIAAIGAIIGDLIGYFLGKKYGASFVKKKYFEKTKAVMAGHTGKTLILGRFNSLTRAFAPFVAGASDIPFMKFLTYNILGGLSWAVSFVFIGYIFGKSYEVASQYIGKFIFIATVVSIAFIYLYRFVNKRKHIFSRYHLHALMLNIFSLYLFAKMIEDVIDAEFITKIDLWINAKIILLWNSPLQKIMIFFTAHIATNFNLIVAAIILLIVLLFQKKWYYSLLFASSMIAVIIFQTLTQFIIHRPEPENALLHISSSSFPDGTAAAATIFFSILFLAFRGEIKKRIWKFFFIGGCGIFFLIILFGRLYLNIHWLSDIIAGFSLGLFWLTLLLLIFKVIISFVKKTRTFFSIFLATIATVILLSGCASGSAATTITGTAEETTDGYYVDGYVLEHDAIQKYNPKYVYGEYQKKKLEIVGTAKEINPDYDPYSQMRQGPYKIIDEIQSIKVIEK